MGHIVVGQAGPKPLWKKIGRNKKEVVDLIEERQGSDGHVIDTGEALPRARTLPEMPEEAAPTAPAEPRDHAGRPPRLSLLRPRIILSSGKRPS